MLNKGIERNNRIKKLLNIPLYFIAFFLLQIFSFCSEIVKETPVNSNNPYIFDGIWSGGYKHSYAAIYNNDGALVADNGAFLKIRIEYDETDTNLIYLYEDQMSLEFYTNYIPVKVAEQLATNTNRRTYYEFRLVNSNELRGYRHDTWEVFWNRLLEITRINTNVSRPERWFRKTAEP